MTKKEQMAVFGYLTNEMKKTLFSKGDDYANEDRLSNFKLAGAISGGNASTNCLNMISTKVARLGNLLNKDGDPNNESIDDSVLDLANYAVLLYMIINENK
jgi:hypothetical protein